ncbi:MAG: hypothetical protein ACOH2V_03695 [Candidatus Saccharimonadaceae bacterium]
MKKVIILIIPLFLLIYCCSEEIENDSIKIITKVDNKNLLASTALYSNWVTIQSIKSSSHTDLRIILIENLNNKVKEEIATLDSLNDNDLCWWIMLHKFIVDSKTLSSDQISNMFLRDLRKKLIAENAINTKKTTSYLESLNNADNLRLAYKWWFEKNLTTKKIIDELNNVAYNNPIYGLKDNRNKGMDVLRIIRADEVYKYLGVYHYLENNTTNFKLYLAGSDDLVKWNYITELGERSHQGDIVKWNNGYLIANEQDIIHGSNNIRIRYYESYSDMVANKSSKDKTLERQFAPTAEGTPDIRIITGNTPDDSHILIGFHYYENILKDQLAFGILKDFSEWEAWKDVTSNSNIEKMGYKGNIGARKTFRFSDLYFLQEAQLVSNNWGSWRLLFGNGAFYYSLNPITALKSTSFANPGITKISSNEFVVTSYLFSEGSNKEEQQQLLYRVKY